MAKNRKGRKGSGGTILIVGLVAVVAVVAADFTVLKGKLGISRFINNLKFPQKFDSPIGPGGSTIKTRAPYSPSPTTPGAFQGAGNTPEQRAASTGGGVGGPSSNFARHSFYSIRDRITLSS